MTNNLKRAIDADLSRLRTTERERAMILENALEGRQVKKKLSVAFVLIMTLLLIAATALAVSVLSQWLTSVETMVRENVLVSWTLDDKVRFIQAMSDAGLNMDKADYDMLMNDALPESEREGAADRIVDDRYGDAMRESSADWVQPPDTILGMAPDPAIIFRDAFTETYPNATEQDARDALTRWYQQMSNRASPTALPTPKPNLDKDDVTSLWKSHMTEVYSWSQKAVDNAHISVLFHDEHQLWEVVGRVDKAALSESFEPILDEPYVHDLGDQYESRVFIDSQGRATGGMTLEEYIAQPPALTWNVLYDDLCRNARLELMRFYGLTQEQADALFDQNGDVYTGENNVAMQAILFREHDTGGITTDWLYAVIMDSGTGKAVDRFTPEELWDEERLQKLATAYPGLSDERRLDYIRFYSVTYNPEGGFCGWSPEHKAAFCALFQPLAEAELVHNPSSLIVEATRRTYGVPGEGELSQTEASVLARHAGEQALAFAAGTMDNWMVCCSFDVTNAEKPIWRFVFSAPSPDYSQPWMCAVYLDARTGEALEAFDAHTRKGWNAVSELL